MMNDHVYCSHGSNDCETCDYWVLEEVSDHEGMDLGYYRATAYEWHGGQGSALYSFASTGDIYDGQQLLKEIAQCFKVLFESGQYSKTEQIVEGLKLAGLRSWIEVQEGIVA
jgi:hypothetical protein